MASVTIDRSQFDAVVFDMDGVVTNTTSAHKEAWKETFDEFLRSELGPDAEPFDMSSDYLAYVDGMPRYDGVRSFLASRGIELPEGAPDDSVDERTVCGVGNRKNSGFQQLLGTNGADAYQSTLDLIDGLLASGVKTALVTSSRNAVDVLDAAGVGDVFGVVIDGALAAELGIPGKPAPDVFVEAVRRIGVDPPRSVLVEDAESGVAAGAAGGFGQVIGIARDDNEAALIAAGADVVVTDLIEVKLVDESG